MKRFKLVASIAAFVIATTVPLCSWSQVHGAYQERPIPMGVSISTTPSSPFIFAGTAGMLVNPFGRPDINLILSNAHVLSAAPPDLCPNSAPGGMRVTQPGTLDLGFDPGTDPFYDVALFVKAVPIDFNPDARNLVDAAVAVTSDQYARAEILGIGVPQRTLGDAAPGMQLIKSGRTTGVTEGTVLAVHSTVSVSYGTPCGSARFVDQVVTSSSIGSSGDSGSVVLDAATHIPVGLYFAGSSATGVLNRILWVYLSLGVFVEGTTAAAPPRADALQLDARLEKLKPLQEKWAPRLLRVSGVNGIGLGFSEDGSRPALIVFGKKLTPQLRRAIPDRLDAAPVRLVESGHIVAH